MDETDLHTHTQTWTTLSSTHTLKHGDWAPDQPASHISLQLGYSSQPSTHAASIQGIMIDDEVQFNEHVAFDHGSAFLHFTTQRPYLTLVLVQALKMAHDTFNQTHSSEWKGLSMHI